MREKFIATNTHIKKQEVLKQFFTAPHGVKANQIQKWQKGKKKENSTTENANPWQTGQTCTDKRSARSCLSEKINYKSLDKEGRFKCIGISK